MVSLKLIGSQTVFLPTMLFIFFTFFFINFEVTCIVILEANEARSGYGGHFTPDSCLQIFSSSSIRCSYSVTQQKHVERTFLDLRQCIHCCATVCCVHFTWMTSSNRECPKTIWLQKITCVIVTQCENWENRKSTKSWLHCAIFSK